MLNRQIRVCGFYENIPGQRGTDVGIYLKDQKVSSSNTIDQLVSIWEAENLGKVCIRIEVKLV